MERMLSYGITIAAIAGATCSVKSAILRTLTVPVGMSQDTRGDLA